MTTDVQLLRSVVQCVESVLSRPDVAFDDSLRGLGMSSVQAVRLRGDLRNEFGVTVPLRMIFEAEDVEALAACVARGSRQHDPSPRDVTPVDRQVTLQQQQFWLLHNTASVSHLYNDGLVAHISGDLDADALELALHHTTQRHPTLRTAISLDQGELVQRELPAAAVEVERFVASVSHFNQLTHDFLAKPYDIETAAPSRAVLIHDSSREAVLVWGIHHIAIDGLSLPTLVQDVVCAYERARQGTLESAQVDHRYAEYLRWQQGALRREDVDWWVARLAENGSAGDAPRSGVVPHGRADISTFTMSAPLASRLESRAAELGVSVFTCVLAALAEALDHDMTTLAVPAANRSRREDHGVVGPYVNTLILRLPQSEEPGLASFVTRIGTELVEALERQNVPWPRIRQEAALRGQQIPLAEVLVSEQPSFDALPEFGDTHTRWLGDVPARLGVALAPIEGSVRRRAGQLDLDLRTLPDHVSKRRSAALMRAWVRGLEAIAEDANGLAHDR